MVGFKQFSPSVNLLFLFFLLFDIILVLHYSNPYRWVPLFHSKPTHHPFVTQEEFKKQSIDVRTAPYPKLIHQSWKSQDIPKRVWDIIPSWKALHPGWDYIFWTDQDNLRLWDTLPELQKYKKMIEDFQRLPPILIVDITRYALMYAFGGVYADIDFEALKPFDELFSNSSIVVGSEPPEHSTLLYGKDMVLCNALLVSRPKQLFWLYLLDYIFEDYFLGGYRCNPDPIQCTGPLIMQDAYERFVQEYPVTASHLLIANYSMFYPSPANRDKSFQAICSQDNLPENKKAVCIAYALKAQSSAVHKPDSVSSYAMHHWHCGWCGENVHKTESVKPISEIVPSFKSPKF